MNEIKISKRVVILSLVLLGAAAAAGWGAPQIMGWLQAKAIVKTTPTPAGATPAVLPEADGRDAAIAGARQFYSVDYSKGQQAWLDNLCAVSTQIGCLMDQNVIAPNLWSQFVQAKTVTTVQVTALEKVQDQVASTRGNAPAPDLAAADPAFSRLAHAEAAPDQFPGTGPGHPGKRRLEV